MSGKFMTLASLTAVALFTASTHAAALTWDGSDGTWATPASWGGSTPDLITPNDTAAINAGTVTFVPGGDFQINSTLTIGGTGTWIQDAGSIAWIKVGNTGFTGNLVINAGGTFDTGGSSQLIVGNGGTGNVTVSGTLNSATTIASNNDSVVTINTGGSLSTVNYNLSNTSTLNIAGGSFTVTNAFNFLGGTLNVSNGGIYNRTGNFVLEAGRLVTLSGSGSQLNIAGEFKPVDPGTASISGGTLVASLISFDKVDAAAVLPFSGGRIELSNLFADAIFSVGGDDYIDFSGAATGVLYLAAGSETNANNLINSGKVRYNGVAGAEYFNVNLVDGGVEISAIAIPEPATMALFGIGSLLIAARRRR